MIKYAVDTKAKINCQALFLIRKSNIYYLYGYRPMKKESEHKKDSKIKKTSNISSINQNSCGSGQVSLSGHIGQTSGRSEKNSCHL